MKVKQKKLKKRSFWRRMKKTCQKDVSELSEQGWAEVEFTFTVSTTGSKLAIIKDITVCFTLQSQTSIN